MGIIPNSIQDIGNLGDKVSIGLGQFAEEGVERVTEGSHLKKMAKNAGFSLE